jgi:hypothetical protein
VRVESASNSFVGCYLETNGGYGINFVGTTSRHNILISTDLWRNETGGVRIGQQNTIVATTFRENTGPGVLMDSTTLSTVRDCKFIDDQGTKTQTHAVEMTGTANRFEMSDCEAYTNNTSTGVALVLTGRDNRLSNIRQDVSYPLRSSAASTTLTFADLGKTIEFTSFSTPATLTVPADSTSGVTVRGVAALAAVQFSWGRLVKRFDNDWLFLLP